MASMVSRKISLSWTPMALKATVAPMAVPDPLPVAVIELCAVAVIVDMFVAVTETSLEEPVVVTELLVM